VFSSLRLPIAATIAAAIVMMVASPAAAAPRSLPATDAMYIVSCDSVGGTEVLFSVDAVTAESTAIGTGIGGDVGCAGQPAWDRTTDTAYYLDFSANTLLSIDLATGVSTTKGAFLDGVNPIQIDAIAITLDGTAYALGGGNFYDLNLSDASLQFVGLTIGNTLAFAVDPTTGLLYAVDQGGDVYSIDATDGNPVFNNAVGISAPVKVLSLQIDSAGTFWYLNQNGASDLWSSTIDFVNTAELSGTTTAEGANVFSQALLIAPNTIPPAVAGSAPTLSATGSEAPSVLLVGGASLLLLLGVVLVIARRRTV